MEPQPNHASSLSTELTLRSIEDWTKDLSKLKDIYHFDNLSCSSFNFILLLNSWLFPVKYLMFFNALIFLKRSLW